MYYALLGGLLATSWAGTTSPTASPTTAGPSIAPSTTAPSTSAPSPAPSAAPTTTAPASPSTSSPSTSSPTRSPTVTWENIALSNINVTCGLTASPYKQFSKMAPPLCLILSTGNYITFYPEVDDFTLLEVQNSFNTSWLDPADNSPVYVRAEVGTVTSYWRGRSQGTGVSKLTVPFWTLIIEVSNGQVQQITWDDSCPLCESEDLCVNGRSCGVSHSSCFADNNCNLQIYVGWFGTDENGQFFTSSDKRLSQFRSGSLLGAYNSALKKANNIAEVANPIPTLTG